MEVRFKFRRGVAAEWTTDNTILFAGELGLESDTGKFKIGDGVRAWNDLTYYLNATDTSGLIQTAIDSAVLNGVPGTPGASAYDVAVANGFAGTQTAWLLSLIGPKGDPGDQGPQGSIGATGPKGDPGDLNRVAVVLPDQAIIATDCSLGNRFRVTLGGNRTLGNPIGMTDGQSVIWEIIQDAVGNRTLTLDTSFVLGADIVAVTLSTSAGKRDFIGAIWNATAGRWSVVALARGY